MASLVELRDRLRRRPGMAGLADEQVEDLLDEAADMVREYCGWPVWPRQTVTVVVDARGGDMVPLPTLMLHEVTSVEQRPLFDQSPAAWQPVEGGWDWSEGGWLLRCGCWPDGPRSLRVVMDSGYEEPPGAVGSVLLALAVGIARRPGRVASMRVGGESVTYQQAGGSGSGAFGELSDGERAVLDRYRLDNRP